MSDSFTALQVEMPSPSSQATVQVRIIDTTTRIQMPVDTMFSPLIKGHEILNSPSYSFLIEHPQSGQKALFDLGCQKDWENQAESTVEMIHENGWKIDVEKDVAEILSEGGVELSSINAIIWSHHHWDHLGDPATFPTSAELIVGPGFKEELFPVDEPDEDSPIKPSYYANRTLRELPIESFDKKVGDFPAHDLYGDGSFFLIASPGHTDSHLSALARTTSNPDTYIFLGGDIASHRGELLPTSHYPLPSLITPNPLNPSSPSPCPAHLFTGIHWSPSHNTTTPFYRSGTWPDGDPCNDDPEAAEQSQQRLMDLEGRQKVLVVLAHDEHVGEVVDLFPKTANEWFEKGWGEKARWLFLGDFKDAIESSSS